MPTIQLASGKTFTAGDQDSLLDAALNAGVTFDHSCRSGRCHACKARLLSGQTEILHDETGLSRSDHASGWILTCARRAVSDITLDINVLEGVTLFPARTYPCKIQTLERVAPDVLNVVLRLPPTQVLQYSAGQYVDIVRRDGLRRSYSLANVQTAANTVELHIRQVPDGAMSHYWFSEARPNDLLQLKGPLGSFVLRDTPDYDLIFLATGTGIAPVKAMLGHLANPTNIQSVPRSITVVWGGRQPADLYWNPHTTGVALRYLPVLSRAGADWQGERGHVQNVLLAHHPDLTRAVVYACGSNDMIESAQTALVSAGLDPKHFHSDAFLCSA